VASDGFHQTKTILCEQRLACKLLQVESTETVPRMGSISAVKTETLFVWKRGEQFVKQRVTKNSDVACKVTE